MVLFPLPLAGRLIQVGVRAIYDIGHCFLWDPRCVWNLP